VTNKVNLPRKPESISLEMIEKIQTVGQNDLAWLNGYCAGLFDARVNEKSDLASPLSKHSAVNTENSPEHQLEQAINVAIIYGSQTGNAQSIAESLHQRINNYSNNVSIENIANVKAKTLNQYSLLVFVVSTHGEGEPPDDAIEFFELLQSRRAPKLEATKHAVLGLGDSSYEFFCETGKQLESLLIKAGSQSAIARVDCDLDYNDKADTWSEAIQTLIITDNEKSQSQRVEQDVSVIQQSDISLAKGLETVEPRYNKQKPFSAEVLANQRITAADSDKIVHHIELLIEGSGLDYLPGDSVGIWVPNNEFLVNEILNKLSIDSEQTIVIGNVEKSVEKALIEDLEVTLLGKNVAEKYAALVDLKAPALSGVVEEHVINNFSAYVNNHQLIDLIELAPIQLSATELQELLTPIKPRVYSIASSLLASPDELHITVKLDQSENEQGFRYGAASNYLTQQVQEEQTLEIYVESNTRFKLPDNDSPVIMIGPGTGIAPFRGFLQQRSILAPESKNWLFFGNSFFNSEFLYQVELQDYLQSGLLTYLDVAFSRDQEHKIYVQDKLLESAEKIWIWLNELNASLYVCGDMKYMAKDVEATLLEIIQKEGELSEADAKTYLKALQKNKRYQRDVY
jgi:sulfite reductase (NADPH) flavoprotein alpha-component